MRKIWGIEYEEQSDGQIFVWKAVIRNPFMNKDGKFCVGLNEKFLNEALRSGVSFLLLVVGNREIRMSVPTERFLKQKTKAKEFELKDSLFENSSAMKIYHFPIE